jgi:hypothetical protein
MQRLVLLALATSLAVPVLAQSNTVVGLDGRLSDVDDLSFWGRRGAAHPNGEIGMAMLNTMCNPGTVNIPWFAAMQANHPKFGFLITRESGGRMVQISDWSFCKHAFTSTNFSGACGTCQNPGTGSLMGVHCSDTYGAGNNGDPNWLGPPQEIDPWLGTWNPVGSYFDVGDPATGTGPADGVRSLNIGPFDQVKNRVTVREQELTVAGRFFYGIHLIHQGESAANRGDNLASRGFTPVHTGGGNWTLNNNAIGQSYGSILHHWTNSTIESAGNGSDDGKFYVAVVTTALGGGNYHYEYAVHNFDNSRGGASFRVPFDPGATVANLGFRDIDQNPLNQWTASVVGNEIVFQAAANNPLNWNSIYNFWFDCNVAPGNGSVFIDQARIGAGALTVAVSARAPNGLPAASLESVGTGCGGTSCDTAFYEMFGSAGGFDLNNSGLTMTASGSGYQVGNGTAAFVPAAGTVLTLGDDSTANVALPFSLPYPGGATNQLVVCSNGFISPTNNGTSFTPSPVAFLAGTTCWAPFWKDLNPATGGQVLADVNATRAIITWSNVATYGIGGSQNTFQVQFFPNGTVHYVWQGTAGNGAAPLTGFTIASSGDPGNRDISATRGAGWTICSSAVSDLAFAITPLPVLGTTVNMNTTNIPAGTPFGAIIVSLQQANPPQDLSSFGMTGCFAYVVGGSTELYFPAGTSHTRPYSITSSTAFLGLALACQSFSFSAGVNQLGVAASNGVVMTLGM